MPQPPTDPEIPVFSPEPSEPPRRPPLIGVRSFGMTERGLVRESNEDQFLIAALTKALEIQQSSLPRPDSKNADEKGWIFLVADGIGGSNAGEVASALVVESLEDFLVNTLRWFFQLRGPEAETIVLEFQDALRAAEARIFVEAARNPEFNGMGTTLTLAYSLGVNLFVANAGDSRCYVLRQGTLTQLTCDHTLAEEAVRQGLIPDSRKERIFHGHTLTNVVGGSVPGVRTEVHKATLKTGDVVLLATDGLTRCVPDDRIAATLNAESDPETACRQLVSLAMKTGGRDNITVIVARYEMPGGEDPQTKWVVNGG
jgi:protein phosphatase